MRGWTAAFLASCSERGTGAPLAQAAWRVLAAAAGRGDRHAIEAVWRAWLRRPDDDRWELLSTWRDPVHLARALLGAAVEPARPMPERQAIGAFCARHDIAPGAEADRALFYLLTGQHAQHRAADPNGTTLATVYQAAAEPVRAALRQAMADRGDLDLVRVVAAAGGGGHRVPATAGECAYLAAVLARRHEWDELWRLALDFPLAEAVAAARVLPADWRPADEAGRHLLKRLISRTLDDELVMSPGGGYAARWRSAKVPYGEPWDTMARLDGSFRYSKDLEVRDPRQETLADVLGRPLAHARPADLAAVREVCDYLAGRGGRSEPAGLLLACLEYRFGADAALGDIKPMTAGVDDMAL